MTALSLRDLARVFAHLGSTAYGGLAMVEPMRQRVVVEREWLSQKEFLDGLALSQMLPGATVVQLATYVGYRLWGVRGALAAAGAFIGPAFLLMGALSFLYFHWGDLPWVKSLSRGLNAMVIALLLQALWRLGEALGRRWPDFLVAVLALAALVAGVNYFLVLLAAGLLQLILEGRAVPPGRPEPGIPAFSLSMAGLLLVQMLAALTAAAVLLWGLGHWDQVFSRMAWIFFKIGTISFGGGYVMIPILQWEVVDRLGWLTLRQFLDGILLSYATPGPLIILAAFVGFSVRGLAGAALSTFCVFLPPILLIIFLSPCYQQLKESRWAQPVLQGILASLVGMLALVALQMARGTLTSLVDLALMLASGVALLVFKVELRWLVPAVVAASLLLFGTGGGP